MQDYHQVTLRYNKHSTISLMLLETMLKDEVIKGGSPIQARNNPSIALRCFMRALITGAWPGTRGALSKKLKILRMGWKASKAGAAVSRAMRIFERNWVKGRDRAWAGGKEKSSQTLWIEMVERPPMKISLSYSSMARLESPTAGTYSMIMTWSGFLGPVWPFQPGKGPGCFQWYRPRRCSC